MDLDIHKQNAILQIHLHKFLVEPVPHTTQNRHSTFVGSITQDLELELAELVLCLFWVVWGTGSTRNL